MHGRIVPPGNPGGKAVEPPLGRLVAQAKAVSAAPLFDPEILGGFLEAVYAGPLELSGPQIERLRRLGGEALQARLAGLDLEGLLPIEADRAKREILGKTADALAGVLDDGQRDRLKGLARVVSEVFGGSRTVASLGLGESAAPEGPGEGAGEGEAPESWVYRNWLEAFDLGPDQRGPVEAIARDYVREARELLARYGQYGQAGEGGRPLGAEERARLEQDLYELQVRMEGAFRGRLTPELLQAARERPPLLLRFHAGHGGSLTRTSFIGW